MSTPSITIQIICAKIDIDREVSYGMGMLQEGYLSADVQRSHAARLQALRAELVRLEELKAEQGRQSLLNMQWSEIEIEDMDF